MKTMKCLSVPEPWAYLLFCETEYTVFRGEHFTEHFGCCDVINMKRPVDYRGPLLIHVPKMQGPIPRELEIIQRQQGRLVSALRNDDFSLFMGEEDLAEWSGDDIVGIAMLEDCSIRDVDSPWWKGDGFYGWTIKHGVSLPPSPFIQPVDGSSLDFFNVPLRDLLSSTREEIERYLR